MIKRVRALLLVCLLLALAGPPALARVSDPQAVDILERLVAKAGPALSFESGLELIRAPGARFLELFFPESPFYGPKFNIPGVVNKRPDGGYSLFLRDEGSDHHHFIMEPAGLRYMGRVVIQGDLTWSPADPRREGETLGVPSPSSSPSPASGPGDLEDPAVEARWRRLTPASHGSALHHPLAFLWPYELLPRDARTWYRKLPQPEPVFGMMCDVLEGHRPDGSQFKLWVARGIHQVARISLPDPGGAPPLIASYTRFGLPDPRTGYQPYSRLEVTQGARTLFEAVLTDPRFNLEKVRAVVVAREEEAPRRARLPRLPELPVEAVWTAGVMTLVVGLAGALTLLGYRFVRFRRARQRFSQEVILVDEPDGDYSRLLEKMGIWSLPFGPEVLSLERHRLGQRWTAQSTRQPRAVVVAPGCIAEVKSYFYLIKAYVDEGGRVLVMPHSVKAAEALPLKVEFLRMPPGDPRVSYELEPEGLLPRVGDPGRALSLLADQDGILRVEGRAPARALIRVRDRQRELSAAVVAVVPQGRGEWILCQLHLDRGGPRGAAASVLADLLDWVQGRPPYKAPE